MFDLHYDLLTYIYINKDNLRGVKKHLKKIFKDNIKGGIFNLFYMSKKEMKDELGINEEGIDVIKNLEEVDRIIKEEVLIPKGFKYVYGIEGLDYLKDISYLDRIYDLGVRSVNIVWNNDNKFGGGAKGNKDRGLTKEGEDLVRKLVDKKITIDLSHANEKTFYNTIDLLDRLKKEGKKVKVIASHSNLKSKCNHVRNLSDDQILRIKKLGGIIGIVGVKPFCVEEEMFNNNRKKYEKAYIENLKYLKDLLNGVDNIGVASDDMTYYKTNKRYYKHFGVFKHERMKKRLEKLLLKNGFSRNETERILYKNAEEFFDLCK